jgi:hypothetical protein
MTALVVDPTDCAAIKALLDEKLAQYNLATGGGGIRSVQDSDTSRIEYNAPNAQRLLQDIQLLQAQYAACIAGTSPAVLTKPINFVF